MSIDESVIQEIDKQAFPFAVTLADQHTLIAHGMSLRDYFADTALLRTMKEFGTGNENARAVAARVAYEMADAMLAERAK